MDRFVTVTDSAEDLQSAKSVLIVHVLHRGYNAGTFVGLGTAIVVSTIRAIRGTPPANAATPTLSTAGFSPFTAQLLRRSARGSLIGVAFGVFFVTGRMWGRELIEWQDRSWRLLHHPGQTQTDYYSLAGGVIGAGVGTLLARRAAAVQSSPLTVTPLLRPRTIVLGSTAIGSALAIVSMIGIRVLIQTERESRFEHVSK